jgi:hypothetical protein
VSGWRRALRAAAGVVIGTVFGVVVLGVTGSLFFGMVLGALIAMAADELLVLGQDVAVEDPDPDRSSYWTCHVCGELRPDELIGLIQRERRMGPGKLIVNVRYCRDRDACAGGAEELAEQWLDVARDR